MTQHDHHSGNYKAQEGSTQYKQKKTPKGISLITLLIVMITTAFVTFVIYKNLDNVKEIVSIEGTNEMGLHIGDQLLVNGELTADGDFVKYTHRLNTSEYGILGVRSTTINLNSYQGNVKIKATVDDIHADVYIINISSIESLDPVVTQTGEDLANEDEKGKYIKNAGLYFSKTFLLNYDLQSPDSNTKEISLKNTNTDNELVVEYFTCSTSDANINCTQLTKDYSAAAGKSITTAAGVTFYRLSGSNKRYFTNKDRRGYRIRGVEEQELASLAEALLFVNEDYFKNNILQNVSKLCYDEKNKINEVEKYDLSLQNTDIIVSIQGKTFDSNAECILRINPELTLNAEKVSFNLVDKEEEEEVEVEEETEEDKENTETEERDSNVDQFPINLEKSLEFSSSRGYKIIFPAGNISRRAGSTEDKTLGQAGVNCRATLDVDKYIKDRGDVIENPKIKVHECTVKDDFQTSEKYRHLVVQDDRNFIIEILDPAWTKFTENIIVE